MQKNSKKIPGGFFQDELPYIIGKNTRTAIMKYRQSEGWNRIPEENVYYLTMAYPVAGATELDIVRRQGQAMNYLTVAKEFGISKGQLCNIAEKCGCIKRNDIIQAKSKENIDTLMDALLPWVMATKMVKVYS